MNELEGKTMVVTGASAGIGRVTAAELARRGARLLVATRSEERTRPLLAEIAAAGGRAEHVPLDLEDLDSVRRATDELRRRADRLDVLVANAGLAGQRGLTKSGFELHFGTNHVGHFLFVVRLLELLEKSAPSRVVVVASVAHYKARGIDWSAVTRPTRSLTGMPEYRVSKLANVLFARELAKRTKDRGVHVYAVHPGVIASDIWRRVPWPARPLLLRTMRSPEEGARSSLHCAASPDVAGETGLYYHWDCKPRRPSDLAMDDALAAELWRRSEDWTR